MAQRWEYLVARLDLAGGDRPIVRWINGVEVENWKQYPNIWECMNEFGDAGWELIGFELFGTRHTSMVFKHLKE
jgi:hypothetical protein